MPSESTLSFLSGDVHKGVTGIVSGVAGLGSEIRQAKKENHARAKSQGAQADPVSGSSVSNDVPELDGTAIAEENADLKKADRTTVAIRETNSTIPTIDDKAPSNPLPMPVIIPQRRPGEKRKGFAKAYAPVLENAAITQDVWMKFLKDFDDSSQASPILTVIQLGAVVAGFIPDAICQAVAAAIQTAAEISIELQMRKRTNTYLHKMNEEFFMKRGLYAMIMKYKSDADPRKRDALKSAVTSGISVETVDLSDDSKKSDEKKISEEQAVIEVQSGPEPEPIPEKDPNGFRLGVGKTQGALQLPRSAPLIFPGQNPVSAEDAKGFKAKMSRKREFMSSYMDRRAHMHYANKDPESSLVVPEEQRKMKSKWADPNSKVYNNPAVKMLLTGGMPTKIPLDGGMGMGGSMFGGESKENGPESGISVYTMPGQDLIKGVLRQNCLYLMVVNLPSEEELARAREQLKMQ